MTGKQSGAKKRTFADKLTRLPYIIIAIVLAVGMIFVYNSDPGEDQLDLASRKLTFASPLEVSVLPDGATVINDSGSSIFCINTDNTLRFALNVGKDETFTGLTSDADGNIYMYVSKDDPDGVTKDDICVYDTNGNFKKTLYTIDYTAEKSNSEQTIRTSPLRIDNGELFFTKYQTYETNVYSISLDTGKVSLDGSLKSDIPFLYADVEGHPDGVYYYAKITGELGHGTYGGGETTLYSGSFNIAKDEGFRPFYIRTSGDRVFTFDYWASAIYEVKNGSLVEPELSGDADINDNAYELSSTRGSIMGISNGIPWQITGDTVKALKSEAIIPMSMAVERALAAAVYACSLPVMIICFAYIAFWIIWRVMIRGKKIAWKLLVFELLITAVLVGLLWFGISSRYQNYVNQSLTALSQRAALTAQIATDHNAASVTGSGDITGGTYKTISRLLIDEYGLYESESDTAVLFLKESDDGQYIIVASNRGYGDILGFSDVLSTLIDSNGGEPAHEYSSEQQELLSICPVKGDSGDTVGFICLYTSAKDILNQFTSIWSPVTVIGYFILLFVLFILSTILLTRRLNRVARGIQSITDGDFASRVPGKSPDELGTLINCVNDLSHSIENLIDDKLMLTEQVRKSQSVVLSSLAGIVENKSGQTAAHVERVSQCVRLLASKMGYTGKELEYISIASKLHDIGKLFIPAEILEKPGKLTREEFDVVKRHTGDGERLLKNAPGEIMHYARIIALEHHEKWDGSGYMGLKGADIHVEARITAIADVFDALISKRCYKEAYSASTTYDIIISESGRHFDPQIVEVFKGCYGELIRIIADNPDIAA